MSNARLEVQVDDKGPKKLGKTLKDTFGGATKDAKNFTTQTKKSADSLKAVVTAQTGLIKAAPGLAKIAALYKDIAKSAKEAADHVGKLTAAQERANALQTRAGQKTAGGKAAVGAAAGTAAGAAAGRAGEASAEERKYWESRTKREDARATKAEAKEEKAKDKDSGGKMMQRLVMFQQLANQGSPMQPFSAMAHTASTLGTMAAHIPGIGPALGAAMSYAAGGLNIRQQRVSRFLAYHNAERGAFGATDGIRAGTGPSLGMSPEEGLTTAAGFTRASGSNVVFGKNALELARRGLGSSVASIGGLTGGGGMNLAGRGGSWSMSNDQRAKFVESMVGVANTMAKQEAATFGGKVTPGKVEEHLARIAQYTKEQADQGKDISPQYVAGQLAGMAGVGAGLGGGASANTFAGDRGSAALSAMRSSTAEGGSGRMMGILTALGRGENVFEAMNSADSGNFGGNELATTFQRTFGKGATGGRTNGLDYLAKKTFGVSGGAGAAIHRGDWSRFGDVQGNLDLPAFDTAGAGLQAVDARAITSGRTQLKGAAKAANQIFDNQTHQMEAGNAMLPTLLLVNEGVGALQGLIHELLNWLRTQR